MKFFKFLFGAALGTILILVAIGFLLPSQWKVEQTVIINADRERIFPLINNIRTGWPQWSSMDLEDPEAQYTYSGPEEGEGASRSWVSTRKGVGMQKIVMADPNKGVDFEILLEDGHFTLFGEIRMEKLQGSTKVHWKSWGDMGQNPIHKVLGYVMEPVLLQPKKQSLDKLKIVAEGQK